MLNVFPELLAYKLMAPLILRVALGLLFITLGYLALTKEERRWKQVFEIIRFKPAQLWVKLFGTFEIVAGVLLVIGLFTQVAAFFIALLSLAESYIEYRAPVVLKRNIIFYGLIFVIALSLLFSGAGFLAFDWPL